MDVASAILSGYREGNLKAAGQVLTAAEDSEGLELVESLWLSLLGHEIGEPLNDWPVPSTTADVGGFPYIAHPLSAASPWLDPVQNSRLVTNITTITTVNFPATPDDGARMSVVDVGSSAVNLTLNGNGRLIEGAATVVGFPSILNGRTWFYRADLGDWTSPDPLLSLSVLPLPAEFNGLFTSYLAIQLAPRNSQEASPETLQRYQLMLARVRARYRQHQGYRIADPRATQSFQSYGGVFGRGW